MRSEHSVKVMLLLLIQESKSHTTIIIVTNFDFDECNIFKEKQKNNRRQTDSDKKSSHWTSANTKCLTYNIRFLKVDIGRHQLTISLLIIISNYIHTKLFTGEIFTYSFNIFLNFFIEKSIIKNKVTTSFFQNRQKQRIVIHPYIWDLIIIKVSIEK